MSKQFLPGVLLPLFLAPFGAFTSCLAQRHRAGEPLPDTETAAGNAVPIKSALCHTAVKGPGAGPIF